MTYGTLKVNTIVTGTQTVNLDDIVYKSDLSFDSDITLTGSSALKLYDSDSSNYISVQAANVLAANTPVAVSLPISISWTLVTVAGLRALTLY